MWEKQKMVKLDEAHGVGVEGKALEKDMFYSMSVWTHLVVHFSF